MAICSCSPAAPKPLAPSAATPEPELKLPAWTDLSKLGCGKDPPALAPWAKPDLDSLVELPGLFVGTTYEGRVLASTDNGHSWKRHSKDFARHLTLGRENELWGLHGWQGIHEPDEAWFWHSSDDGRHWKELSTWTGPRRGTKTAPELTHIPLGWVRGVSAEPVALSIRPSELVEPNTSPPTSWQRLPVPCRQPRVAARTRGDFAVVCDDRSPQSELLWSGKGQSWQRQTIDEQSPHQISCSDSFCAVLGEALWLAPGSGQPPVGAFSLSELFTRIQELDCGLWTALAKQDQAFNDVTLLTQAFHVYGLAVVGDEIAMAGHIWYSEKRQFPLTLLISGRELSWAAVGASGMKLDAEGRMWAFGPGVSVTPAAH